MKRRARPKSGRRAPAATAASPNPEVVGFIGALLGQMAHAADLVGAFLRGIGMRETKDATPCGMPSQFLLVLAALLQLREWQAAGVIDGSDPDGLTIDEHIGLAIERFRDDPMAMARGDGGTQAMKGVVRRWNETCCHDARGQLGCDVALHWNADLDVEQLVDAFADFLCRHRNVSLTREDA